MKQNINLYQPATQSGKGLDSRRMFFGWLAVLAVAAIAHNWLAFRSSGMEQELRQAQASLDAAEAQMNELTASSMAGTDTELEAQLTEALRDLDLRETILGLVSGDTAGDVGGFSAQLRSLARQPADGVWLTRVRVSAPGGRTTLEGRALSPEAVPLYLRQLSGEEALAGQRFDVFEILRSEIDGEPVSFALNRRSESESVRFARER